MNLSSIQNGYGSIPINTIFSGLFTSINPSYFDVNYRGTIGFDTLPNGALFKRKLVYLYQLQKKHMIKWGFP